MFKGLLVVVLAGFGAVIGWFAPVHFIPAQWQAKAQFEAPKVVELGNYYSLFSTYQLLKGDSHSGNQFDQDLTQTVYQEFTRNLSSPDMLQQFLHQSPFVKKIAMSENNPTAVVAQRVAEQIKFDPSQNQLSATLTNPDQANGLLIDLIGFTTQQTRAMLNAELVAKWKILFQQVKQSAEMNLGAIQQGNQIAQQDWSGKLRLMRSVQPLDNELMPYRFVKSPSVPQQPEVPAERPLWTAIGGGIGLLCGFLISLFIRPTRQKRDV